MGWFYLIVAIACEVAGTTAMKYALGFTRPGPAVAIFAFWGTAIVFLTLALKTLAIGVAYAVWSGLGTVLVALVGLVLFAEPMTAWKALCIGLIVVGVVGLQLGGPA